MQLVCLGEPFMIFVVLKLPARTVVPEKLNHRAGSYDKGKGSLPAAEQTGEPSPHPALSLSIGTRPADPAACGQLRQLVWLRCCSKQAEPGPWPGGLRQSFLLVGFLLFLPFYSGQPLPLPAWTGH